MEIETNPMAGRPQPDADSIRDHPRFQVVDNALLEIHLARLRDRRTSTETFRATGNELARLALWHALCDINLGASRIEGFSGAEVEVSRLAEKIAGIAILRAGLMFEPAFRALLPESPFYQIGVKRDEVTLQPDLYASNVPEAAEWADRVIILDPMLATGGSARAAIEIVRRNHSGRIDFVCLVAAPLGVEVALQQDQKTRVVCVALDERLNDAGFIVPGLGDAGDRYFGTG